MLDRAWPADAGGQRLGRRMYSQNIVLRGRLDETGWRAFLRECIAAMGMTAADEAASWSYPTPGGKGGKGLTVMQPMVESFIVVDTWPDHEGAYLHISSCRKFDSVVLAKPMTDYGIEVQLVGIWEALRL